MTMTIDELKAFLKTTRLRTFHGTNRDLRALATEAGIDTDDFDGPWAGLTVWNSIVQLLDELAAIGGSAVETGIARCCRVALLDLTILGNATFSVDEIVLLGERGRGVLMYLEGLLDGVDPEGALRRYEISLVGL